MARALSIHIGVNTPAGRMGDHPLRNSEDVTWQMAGLAQRAGYESLLVLRGESATRGAVHHAVTGAAGMLTRGDSLLVTFSGHGTQVRDMDADEWGGIDEGWCLKDGVLLDDRLAGYWQLFEAGVRIVVVSESCYSGGMDRDDDEEAEDWEYLYRRRRREERDEEPVYRDEAPTAVLDYSRSCIAAPPRETMGIRATVLLLTASRKDQVSREGLFSRHLLEVWNGGTFEGSYCDLHRAVREQVMNECRQEPQIFMLGSGDLDFPQQRAFYVDRSGPFRGGSGYRG